jgi:hypothetical protein
MKISVAISPFSQETKHPTSIIASIYPVKKGVAA